MKRIVGAVIFLRMMISKKYKARRRKQEKQEKIWKELGIDKDILRDPKTHSPLYNLFRNSKLVECKNCQSEMFLCKSRKGDMAHMRCGECGRAYEDAEQKTTARVALKSTAKLAP